MSDLATRLKNAGKKAEQAKEAKQARVVKGAHLHERIMEQLRAAGLEVVENTGFHKFLGKGNKLKLLVAVKGGRIDLSGFTIESPAVTQVSEEEAKAKHLGKVRGLVNFDAPDEEVLAVIARAITILQTPAEEPKAERKAPKKAAPATDERAEA